MNLRMGRVISETDTFYAFYTDLNNLHRVKLVPKTTILNSGEIEKIWYLQRGILKAA